MVNRDKIVLVFVLLGFLLGSSATLVFAQESQKINHIVKVLNPAIHANDSTEVVLVQEKNGDTNYYYIDVESVSCGTNECKVVPVRIYFDELGNYQKLKVWRGNKLEKAKGKRFRKADYLKLDEVLLNNESVLGRVDKDKLVEQQTDLDGEVDAVTAATTPALPEDSYVKGAVWTCYTLWHWVNSNLKQNIRNITADSKSESQLLTFMESNEETYRIFALEQLTRLGRHGAGTIDLVLSVANDCSSNEQKLIIAYFEAANSDVYFAGILSLLNERITMRSLCLNSLLRVDKEILSDYCLQLSLMLKPLKTYQEIDMMLNILEKYNCNQPDVNNKVFDLFERDNILIGRRAYWFLQDKKLTNEQQIGLKNFYNSHIDYF